MSPFLGTNYYDKPTNVVALFMPLNETKEGCDRALILCSGNQTADWLDSVKVAFLGRSLVESRDYLKGAITVDKSNSIGEIEAITFHFRDFPYNVTTGCRISSKNIDYRPMTQERMVFQYNNSNDEGIIVGDQDSPFEAIIHEYPQYHPIERKDYINKLVKFCSQYYSYTYDPSSLNQLARDNTTTALTFYPKIIDGKTCTVLEYTGLMFVPTGSNYYKKPTNIVGLFVPLNETKEGCDRYLILASGNQTADWLDSVKVSKVNKAN